ncbi:UbiA-like protein EboC [Parapedobacter sp. 10938]|uniref:UbiA-like protein EboC n=1 Tax=Parapedobacter flavus TaxID=3110225 RepID=UPI002DBCD29F|nr:UbiA-like protein EboC [Parapedobacter sp. 10938]MEC3880476.1 UbiA-like protein EboC [Parapedobacter sp. 10938]
MAGLKPYLQLMRPANIVTAISDVCAGTAIALLFVPEGSTLDWPVLVALIIATIGLYGGGVVFNDVFDADLDARERPERPIPSGKVSVGGATKLAMALFLIGVVAAGVVGVVAAMVALSIVVMCLLYDKWAKHHAIAGPLVMGLCRGLNLALGMSYSVVALDRVWFIAFVPVVYIAAVTTISRGEVHGGQRAPLYLSALLYGIVVACIVAFGLHYQSGVWAVGMVLPFVAFVFPPLVKAIRTLQAGDVRKSVKHGVIGLIFMNAAWTAAAGMWGLTLVTLLLFPLSIWLAKRFAVT